MCLRALLQYNALDEFYISGLTWEQGWLRSVCASSQYDQILLVSHIICDRCTYLRHTLDYRKYKRNTQQLHVVEYYNAEIFLHKAIPFSIQHLYCLKYIHTISRTRLNLSLFKNLWFHSLMNVLLNSYHVTAIPSLNHSLLDA